MDHALCLEYLTVGWNAVEAAVAICAGLSANSVALLGFGVDSVVESASGGVLIWRFRAERGGTDACAVAALDRRAHRLVAASLFVLAAFIAADAARALWLRDRPEPSVVGMALTSVSMLVMARLARLKRRAAAALESRALQADSFQTSACWWLSVVTLSGVGLNRLLGWWWADPMAALVMTGFILKEAAEGWRGEGCGCS